MKTLDEKTLINATGCSVSNAQKYLPSLWATLNCFDIDTPTRLAAFLAQIAHESDSFSVGREDMDYSEQNLLDTFPKHFNSFPKDPGYVKNYARQPEKIANRAYGGRMGNGDEASGDGWRYRGGGLMQLTGHDDYKDCGRGIGADLELKPWLIEDPRIAAMSAGWEWDRSNLNLLADMGDFEKITKVINGGLIGYPDRLLRWERAKKALLV